jgi:nucleotide-binding universal stress UspA family protein
LDGSALAEQALPTAQRLARSTGARLLLLQAVQGLDAGSKRLLFANEAEADATIAGWRAYAETYLQKGAGELCVHGVVVEARTAVGDPEKVIDATIVDADIDLVVMSTHGRTGLSRWYYGSTANKVLRSAPCPLLLIRPAPRSEGQD